MTTELIEFNEETSTHSKRWERKHKPVVLINPDHVGAVLPRREYTTLIVQGKYIHVSHLYEEVCRWLGFTKAIR